MVNKNMPGGGSDKKVKGKGSFVLTWDEDNNLTPEQKEALEAKKAAAAAKRKATLEEKKSKQLTQERDTAKVSLENQKQAALATAKADKLERELEELNKKIKEMKNKKPVPTNPPPQPVIDPIPPSNPSKLPHWEKKGDFEEDKFSELFGPLVDKINKAIASLPPEIKMAFSRREVLQIIHDIYLADKQPLKVKKGEKVDDKKADTIELIKAFEHNLDLEISETSGLIVSAIDYILQQSDSTKAIKETRDSYKMSNVDLDNKTKKMTLTAKEDIAKIDREALHEDRVYSEILIKIAAPQNIKNKLTKLWDEYLKANDEIDQHQKQKVFLKEYNIYTSALENVLKVFYEENPVLNTDLEKDIFNNLSKIAKSKSGLKQLLAEYKKNQPDEFYQKKTELMSEELQNTFFLNEIFMKAYKYLEMKNNGRDAYLSSKGANIPDYKLMEFMEEESKPVIPPAPPKPEPNPDQTKPKPKPEVIDPNEVDPIIPPQPNPDNTDPNKIKPTPTPPPPAPPRIVPDKIKIKTAFIAYSEKIIKEHAREMADRKLSADYSDEKGKGFFGKVGNFFKRVWKYGTFREYYRQKEVSKFKKAISTDKNLFVDEDFTINSQVNLNNDIIDRLIGVDDLKDAVHHGENVRLLEDPVIKGHIIDAIKKYANKKMTDAEFIDIQNGLSEQIKSDNGDVFEGTVIDANNLLETAKALRIKFDADKSLENVDIDLDIIIGNMKAGVRSEQSLNIIDRTVDKLHQTKLGSMINETTMASALSIFQGIGNSIGSWFLHNKAAAWGSFGATAALSGTLGAIRARNYWEQKRQQHFRDLASGRPISDKDKQRMELERYRFQSQKVTDAIKGITDAIDFLKNRPDEVNPDILSKSIAFVSLTDAMIKLSDEKSIDLLTYSNPRAVDKERTALDIKMAALKVELRKACEKQGVAFGGMDIDTYMDHCVAANKKHLLEDENGVNEKNAQFRGFKNKKGVTAFFGGTARAILLGVAFQEVGAMFNPHQQGAIESVWHTDTNPASQTFLKSLGDRISGQYNGMVHAIAPMNEHTPLSERPDLIRISNTQELRLDQNGNYDLWANGEMKCNNMLTFKGDQLTYDTDVLQKNGFVVDANSTNIVSNETSRAAITAEQFSESNPDMVDVAGQKDWIRNGTRGIYDFKEQGLGLGQTSNGDPTVDIRSMFTSGGEVPINSNSDVYALVYPKYGDGRAFAIPFKSGQLVIDDNSPLKNFFDIQSGKTIFNGGSIEAAVKEDGIWKILSTHNGTNTVNKILVNIPEAAPQVINKIGFSPISPVVTPYTVPPLAFFNSGRPLSPGAKIKDTNIRAGNSRIDITYKKEDQVEPVATEGPALSTSPEPITPRASKKPADETSSIKIPITRIGREEEKEKTSTTPPNDRQVAAAGVDRLFEGIADGFKAGQYAKMEEYHQRILDCIAGNPKLGDTEEQLKKDFKQVSGEEWTSGFDIDKFKAEKNNKTKPSLTPEGGTAIENDRELSGSEASYELAKLAQVDNVKLDSIGKDEYINFAVKHRIGLDREQLIQSPILRTATSEKQYISIRNKLIAQTSSASISQDFGLFSENIKSRIVDDNPTELESGIKVLPKSKNTNDWLYFKINDGFKKVGNSKKIMKSYITFKDLTTFKLKSFIDFLRLLQTSKKDVDIKIFQDIANQGSISTDQIVIHCNDEVDNLEVANLASQYFGSDILKPSLGYDTMNNDGSITSYSETISQKLKANAQKK